MAMWMLKSTGRCGSSSAFGEWDAGRGSGRRSKAETWELGISGKQNKTVIDGIDNERSVAYIFGDSQLRPVVQGKVKLPRGPIQLIINSTPGGTCQHVEEELLDFSWKRGPDIVVVAAGTNNIGFSATSLDNACHQFRSLLGSALRKTPLVLATSIAPRLDSKRQLVSTYNQAFSKVCREEGVSWVDISSYFPTDDKKLWARDGLHLSECTGIPRLLGVLYRRMTTSLWPGDRGTSTTRAERKMSSEAPPPLDRTSDWPSLPSASSQLKTPIRPATTPTPPTRQTPTGPTTDLYESSYQHYVSG